MWHGREGVDVTHNVPCDLGTQTLQDKLAFFKIPLGLAERTYDVHSMPPGTMMWTTYVKTSGGAS